MNTKDISGFLIFSSLLALLLLLVFGVLQWLHIPAGSLLDWMIGIASFWWLLIIVTIPWNIHFAAKRVLMEAAESRRREIVVEGEQLRYAERIARRALWIALALHVGSALILYLLAVGGVSTLGYIGSIATLLLTGLRPAIALCQYLIERLQSIQKSIRYPREDVVELRSRLVELEVLLKNLAYQLNMDTAEREAHDDSWATQQQRMQAGLRQDLTQLAVGVEELRVDNQADHERLAKEARNAIAQLSTDSQFLEHAREIIRFFKSA
ncbi:MAG: hypothetical protein AAFX78_00345 [Cyanobacteria bacterium J06638_20]